MRFDGDAGRRPVRCAARRLLVATGLTDELPDVPGLAERWGRDVVHCPYCHGWEVRDQAIGVLSSGPMSVHQALMFRQLSDDIVFFTHTTPPFAEHSELLSARGVEIVDGAVTGLEVVDDRLTAVRLHDGTVVGRDVVAVATRMRANTEAVAGLGLHPVEHPNGVGQLLPADPTGRTEVPGVWVAGNVTDLVAQVGGAAAAGASAGAQVNADLVMEEAQRAVEAGRSRA